MQPWWGERGEFGTPEGVSIGEAMSALIGIVVVLAVFIVVAVASTRRNRRRMTEMGTLHRPRFVDPAASDLRSAVDEMFGLASEPGMRVTTVVAPSAVNPALEIATITARNGVWVCAELPRPVALPITFEPWKPRPLAKFERKMHEQVGVVDAMLIDDGRLGRTWLGRTGAEADSLRGLDADPLVWPVVSAMACAVEAAPSSEQAGQLGAVHVAPAHGFGLGRDTAVHFRGRFVVVGPGATINFSGRSRPEDIERAVAFVVAAFDAHEPPV